MTDQKFTLTLLAETMLTLEVIKADYIETISKLTNEPVEAIEKRFKESMKANADKITFRMQKLIDSPQSAEDEQS